MPYVASKKRLAEQIIRRLKGGNPSGASNVHEREIMVWIGQKASELLKVEYFTVKLPNGESTPNNLVIASYDAVAVSTYKTTRSRATLPVIPVGLPRNMGVYRVSSTTDLDAFYVPMDLGQWGMLKNLRGVSNLASRIGYEVEGKYVVFTQDLPGLATPINTVFMRLVVVDPDILGDYDLLPVTPDMQAEIIRQGVEFFSGEPMKDSTVDGQDKA